MNKPKQYDKRNDAYWCGRYIWAILGILFIAVHPSGLKEIIHNDNKAFVGLMFLMVALIHHLLYAERKRTRDMLNAISEATKQQEDTQHQPAP